MATTTLQWIDSKKELPIIDNEHEEGEIPYLGIYCEEEYYDESDDDFDLMGIVYYYGNGHWKNSRWEHIYVSHWLEIPEAPTK